MSDDRVELTDAIEETEPAPLTVYGDGGDDRRAIDTDEAGPHSARNITGKGVHG